MLRMGATKGKEVNLTKTVGFALGGKVLARIFFWVGGEKYMPESRIHLKLEPKKIRNVANSDLVSFVKNNSIILIYYLILGEANLYL